MGLQLEALRLALLDAAERARTQGNAYVELLADGTIAVSVGMAPARCVTSLQVDCKGNVFAYPKTLDSKPIGHVCDVVSDRDSGVWNR